MFRHISRSSRRPHRLSGLVALAASIAIATGLLAGCGSSASNASGAATTLSSSATASSVSTGASSVSSSTANSAGTKSTTSTASSSAGAGFATGAAVCAAFPVAQVAATAGLSLDNAIAGTKTAVCNYESKADATAGAYTIQFEPGATIAVAKKAFPNGQVVAGLGDDAWYDVSSSTGTLHVQKGSTEFFVQFVGVGLKAKPSSEQMLAVNKAMAVLVLAKV